MNKVTDLKIAREARTSLHIQLYTALSQLILAGHWLPGSQIPSETQLGQHFNISRTTVRLALQHAEIEGLITRLPGRGTFVAENIPTKPLPYRSIAFVTNRFDRRSHQMLLSGAEATAKQHDYRIIFCHTESIEEEIETLQKLAHDEVAGVLLWPSHTGLTHYEAVFEQYRRKNRPIMLTDRYVEGSQFDCVTSNNYESALKLMQYLIGQGHEHIVFLSHRHIELNTVQERYCAYVDAMEKADLVPQDPWLVGPAKQEVAISTAITAFQNPQNTYVKQIGDLIDAATQPISALFVVNANLALVALASVQHLEIAVPDAITVACFDDADASIFPIMPLTMVVQDMYAIGQQAAQRLIARIEGFSGPPTYDVVPAQLAVRQSTSVPV